MPPSPLCPVTARRVAVLSVRRTRYTLPATWRHDGIHWPIAATIRSTILDRETQSDVQQRAMPLPITAKHAPIAPYSAPTRRPMPCRHIVTHGVDQQEWMACTTAPQQRLMLEKHVAMALQIQLQPVPMARQKHPRALHSGGHIHSPQTVWAVNCTSQRRSTVSARTLPRGCDGVTVTACSIHTESTRTEIFAVAYHSSPARRQRKRLEESQTLADRPVSSQKPGATRTWKDDHQQHEELAQAASRVDDVAPVEHTHAGALATPRSAVPQHHVEALARRGVERHPKEARAEDGKRHRAAQKHENSANVLQVSLRAIAVLALDAHVAW
jgi:hypothetical protein